MYSFSFFSQTFQRQNRVGNKQLFILVTFKISIQSLEDSSSGKSFSDEERRKGEGVARVVTRGPGPSGASKDKHFVFFSFFRYSQ